MVHYDNVSVEPDHPISVIWKESVIMYANTNENQSQSRRCRAGKKINAVECNWCGLYGMCQVAGLNTSVSGLIEKVVSRHEEVAVGQCIVTAGQPLAEIIAVRSGAFKTTVALANGAEQVVDFFLPGELMGLDALSDGLYSNTIVALEHSTICRFHLSRLYLLEERMGDIQQQMIRAFSRQTRRDQWVPLLMGAKNAEQRMALFLLGLSSRFIEHGLPSQRFRLPMSRQFIADYLGLAMETVSRVLKRFHSQGLIDVHARNIDLYNIDDLRVVAGMSVKSFEV